MPHKPWWYACWNAVSMAVPGAAWEYAASRAMNCTGPGPSVRPFLFLVSLSLVSHKEDWFQNPMDASLHRWYSDLSFKWGSVCIEPMHVFLYILFIWGFGGRILLCNSRWPGTQCIAPGDLPALKPKGWDNSCVPLHLISYRFYFSCWFLIIPRFKMKNNWTYICILFKENKRS